MAPDVLWLIAPHRGAEFVQPSPPAAAQFMQTSLLTWADPGHVLPAPRRRLPSRHQLTCEMFYSAHLHGCLPPGCRLSEKKRRAECVSEVSGMGSRFASCFRNLLEDRRQTSNNQSTCFQTTSVFRLRSDESRDLDWDQRWFSVQTYFRGVCWYVWKQLGFYFRIHISSPWEDYYLCTFSQFLPSFINIVCNVNKDHGFVFIPGCTHWGFISVKLLRFTSLLYFLKTKRDLAWWWQKKEHFLQAWQSDWAFEMAGGLKRWDRSKLAPL